MPPNTVYNREIESKDFDNVEGDAHMIISVILYSMALVLGLLVIVGLVL